MIFLVLEAQATIDTKKYTTITAWVNNNNQNTALTLISEHLASNGWQITHIVECDETKITDYFPPCKSLDAYKEAEIKGFAIRYS